MVGQPCCASRDFTTCGITPIGEQACGAATPDIVLRLRGDFELQQIDLFEQLADHLRAYILSGGVTPTPSGDPREQEGGQG